MNGARRNMFKYRHNSSILAISLLSLLVLGVSLIISLITTPNYSKATESADAEITLNISSALTMSLANCDVTYSTIIKLDVEPTPQGAFKSNCQTVSVLTNNPGYTLTAKSSDTTLTYQNPTEITPLPTIPSTLNTIGGTPAPNVLGNNTWGFAVEGNTSQGFDAAYAIDNANNKYALLPSSDETTIYYTNEFPIPKTDHKFYYATKLTPATIAGTYTTTITYTAIGEPVPEPIKYPKIGNGVYFQDTTYNINQSCVGLPIYDSNLSEQDNAASTVTMIDSRNNQEYRVRRLQDGRCWMIDNLKLELTNGMALTPADTNVEEDITIYFTQDGTSTDIALTGMTGNFTTSGYMTRDGTNTNTTPPNFDAWRQADPSNTTNCLNNISSNANIPYAYSPDSTTGCGYLYNWYTSTASTGTQSMSSLYAGSICPTGWSLPAYNPNDFGILNNSMLNNTLSANAQTNSAESRANWFPNGDFQGSISGLYFSGLTQQGQTAHYWSSKELNSTNAFRLYFNYDSVLPGGTASPMYYGASVRCIL